MGRYDKIKVYDGSSWRTPSRIRANYGGSWLDFGSNTDTSARRILRVRKSSGMVTCTKHAVVSPSTTSDYHIVGSFKVLPDNGFCFQSQKSEFLFECTARKTSSGNKRLFFSGTGTGNSDSYIKVTWLENGKIEVVGRHNGSTSTITSSNAVTALNTDAYIKVSAPKNADNYVNITVNLNGTTVSGINYRRFNYQSVYNNVGDSGIEFRNTVRVIGYQGYGSNAGKHDVTVDCNNASGSSTTYSGVTSAHTTNPGSTSWVDD